MSLCIASVIYPCQMLLPITAMCLFKVFFTVVFYFIVQSIEKKNFLLNDLNVTVDQQALPSNQTPLVSGSKCFVSSPAECEPAQTSSHLHNQEGLLTFF